MNNSAESGSVDYPVSRSGPGTGQTVSWSLSTYQDTLYYKQKAAAEAAEAQRLEAQNELEKTKTDYLVEQIKGMGLPDYARVDVPIAVEQESSPNLALVGLIGLGIWLLMKRKGK